VSTALRARNGEVELAYELLGDGPPLLLIQGLGYGGRGWGPVLEALAEDFTVAAFDNRGFGASDIPPGPYSARDLAEDALAVLEAAGFDRARVVGASLGGMVAQELALAHPERIDKLVLACTTPGGVGAYPMPAATVSLMLEAPALAPDVALRKFVENAVGETASEALVEEIVAYRTANPPDLAGWQAQAMAGATHDAIERISAITAPTLIVHGTDDRVVDHRNAEVLAERIPNARVELLPGVGHMLTWEQPERFAALLKEFLQ
jgi:pimeloyl-ACP methyl ester carboxylesterase